MFGSLHIYIFLTWERIICFEPQNDWKYDECLDAKLAEKYFAPYYEFCKRQRAIQREKEKAINAAKKQAKANNNVSSDK